MLPINRDIVWWLVLGPGIKILELESSLRGAALKCFRLAEDEIVKPMYVNTAMLGERAQEFPASVSGKKYGCRLH